ncbi:MAG: calcium-binding protein [Methylobacterium frigidaeris]
MFTVRTRNIEIHAPRRRSDKENAAQGGSSMSAGPAHPASSTVGNQLSDFALAAAHSVYMTQTTAYDYDKTNGIANNPANIGLDASGQFYSYVDCSTWVNFALSSVSPIHAAALGSSINASIFNQRVVATVDNTGQHGAGTPELVNLDLREQAQPWPQAYADTYFFDQVADGTNGFTQITNIQDLRAGDILAWSLGIYTDPNDSSLPTTEDTGHVMIVTGQAVPYTGRTVPGSLQGTSSGSLTVYAVPVVDSSSVPHGHPQSDFTLPAVDTRDYQALPEGAPASAKPGGLGRGTLYFSADATGAIKQFSFDVNDPWHPSEPDGGGEAVKIAVGRMESSIALAGDILKDGYLTVNLLANATPTLNGVDYDTTPVTITGAGGLKLTGSGNLTLTGTNSYTGGTLLTGGTLELGTLGAAGTGGISFGDDAQTLRIHQSGILANRIGRFDLGDMIDLQALSYSQSGSLRYDAATGALTLGEGSGTVTLTIDAASAGTRFVTSADDDGSTLLRLQQTYTVSGDTANGRTITLLDPAALDSDIATTGTDTVSYAGAGSLTLPEGIENATLTGDRNSGVTGSVLDNLVTGNGGDNMLAGNSGNDTLFGNAGNDLVLGQDGNDFIGAGAGDDFGSGGWGNDEVHGEGGNDLLFGDDGDDGVYGEDGDDRVYGGTGNDYLTGDAGTDYVRGEDGDDRLFGGEGGDDLSGGAGNDTIEGGAGFDLLFGNAGDDVLTGGAGPDIFGLGRGDGRDVIRDFVTGGAEADVIAFNGGAFADFAAVQAATRQEGADVVIAYGAGDGVTLQNLQASALSAANFTFA